MYFRFMNDVTFGRSGPYGASDLATPGRSLMSTNTLFLICHNGLYQTQESRAMSALYKALSDPNNTC